MRSPSYVLAAALLAALPALAAAQSRGSSPLATNTAFEATPYVGYMFFGDYLSGPLGTSRMPVASVRAGR